MTAPETPETPEASEPTPAKKRSPALVAGIVIALVVVLAGGAFVIYKLTNKTEIKPAFDIAKQLQVAIVNGDKATITKLSTPAGDTALLKITPDSIKGMQFGGCQPFPGTDPIRVCTWTRPGGQFTVKMVHVGDSKDWVADAASLGPVATTPTSAPSATSTTSTP